MDERICSQCGERKAAAVFAVRRDYCRECGRKLVCARYRKRHGPRLNQEMRARRKSPTEREKNRRYRRAYRDARPWLKRLYRKRWRARRSEACRESIRRRVKRRYARKKGAKGTATKEQLTARVAFYGGLCWICRAPYTEMDHVKPLACGGAHIPANLRPICGSCNRRKQDRWPFDPRMIA